MKSITKFFLEDFYRNFILYYYLIKPKEELSLKLIEFQMPEMPKLASIEGIPITSPLQELAEFLPSAEPVDSEQEYNEMKKARGKKKEEIDINKEIQKLMDLAEDKIKKFSDKTMEEQDKIILETKPENKPKK